MGGANVSEPSLTEREEEEAGEEKMSEGKKVKDLEETRAENEKTHEAGVGSAKN